MADLQLPSEINIDELARRLFMERPTMQQPYVPPVEQQLDNLTSQDLKQILVERYFPSCKNVEGWKNFFYVDGGSDTPVIASGCMVYEETLENVVLMKGDRPATLEEKIADYRAAKKNGGGAAAQAKRSGRLSMPEEEMERFARQKIGGKVDLLYKMLREKGLGDDPVDFYKKYGSGPMLGLLDLVYSAGNNVNGFKNTWRLVKDGNFAALKGVPLGGQGKSRTAERHEHFTEEPNYPSDLAILADAAPVQKKQRPVIASVVTSGAGAGKHVKTGAVTLAREDNTANGRQGNLLVPIQQRVR